MTNGKYKKEIIFAAIGGLVIIEIVALMNGINGTLMTMITAMIAGLAGWTQPQLKIR